MGIPDLETGYIKENMMGPNALLIVDELTRGMTVSKNMRVLDLGCGRGLTSVYLAKKYGALVFATDLWISATDNYNRFRDLGVSDRIVPIHAEARSLPFADNFFDAVVSVDAYHYFGFDREYLPKYLMPLVKRGGSIAIAVPGLKKEFTRGVPAKLLPYWTDDMNFHSCGWWKELWEASSEAENIECSDMECFEQSWLDWLACDNEYAREDIGMMSDGGWKYFSMVSIKAKRSVAGSSPHIHLH